MAMSICNWVSPSFVKDKCPKIMGKPFEQNGKTEFFRNCFVYIKEDFPAFK